MFVYLLIASELGILYLLFWFLYLREPDDRHCIDKRVWEYSNYNDTKSGINISKAQSSIDNTEQAICCSPKCPYHDGQYLKLLQIKPFMVAAYHKMTLNSKINHSSAIKKLCSNYSKKSGLAYFTTLLMEHLEQINSLVKGKH